MKSLIPFLLVVTVATVAACTPQERTVVILSTNDMHAKIQRMPQLASAVKACRDTVQTVMLVDAGDRWTGNAYVDMAPQPGMPMIRLMNRLGYRVATLGNHEFDHGQAFLGRLIDSMKFDVVCANIKSDTITFPQLSPSIIVKENGLRIGFVGVVTNYEGPGHPAGNASSFAGLEFPDPQKAALDEARRIRPKCDILILLSHMGDDRDAELLSKNQTPFDLVIGGHTHELINKRIGGVLLTQTGKDLKNVGATVIRMRGRKIVDIRYRIISLENYPADPAYQMEVDRTYADPLLNRAVGHFSQAANKWGVANWLAQSIRGEEKADIGVYHVGGIRVDSLPEGGISTAKVYSLEPFGTQIATFKMTPADLRRMIISKYNDPDNKKEGHRIDLIMTTPYQILTDAANNAVDVLFPKLKEDHVYKIAIADYIYQNYKDLHYTEGKVTNTKVTDILMEELTEDGPIHPNNTPLQSIAVKE